jgi:hypothetical protein
MRTLLLALLLLPGLAPGQDLTRTVSERRPGVRSLTLSGIFTGSDTAYMQVYHDGEELHSDVYVGTWTITLGACQWYMIKFTDGKGRVKRLAVHELSDDMVEFFPPIEIDFDREGNMVLIKQSHGKPDWVEYDVGLSRKR